MKMNPLLILGALGAAGLAFALGGKKAHAAPAPTTRTPRTQTPPGVPVYVTEDPVEEAPSPRAPADLPPTASPRPPADLPPVDPDLIPTPATRAPSAPTPKVMSRALQKELAEALRRLTVDSHGVIVGPVDKADVQFATKVVGRLRSAGFPEVASKLDTYAKRAAELVDAPTVEEEVPLPPGLPQELKDRIQRAIQLERDPAKVKALIGVLMKLPASPERDNAIKTLQAMVVQLEAEAIAKAAAAAADDVVSKKPEPVAKPLPPEPAPPAPEPAPVPAPKSPTQQAAAAMAAHLKSVQKRHGMPGAKGKEDKAVVRKFQKLAGLKADGLAGPGTLAKAATTGQGDLPLVMYWPRGSSRNEVQKYRDTLRRFANESDAQGFTELGNQLRMVANYERGQAGVGQWGVKLT